MGVTWTLGVTVTELSGDVVDASEVTLGSRVLPVLNGLLCGEEVSVLALLVICVVAVVEVNWEAGSPVVRLPVVGTGVTRLVSLRHRSLTAWSRG